VVGAASALVAGTPALAAGTPMRPATLSGTCTVATTLDANGAVTASLVSCAARGSCTCAGPTSLVYRTATASPGNGAPGRERGTLTAAGPHGSVTLDLTGTRTGVGASQGSWRLDRASGFTGVSLVTHGVYRSQTTDLHPITGTRSTTVRITASIGCWDCRAQR
jgi:hypothetical protein